MRKIRESEDLRNLTHYTKLNDINVTETVMKTEIKANKNTAQMKEQNWDKKYFS